VNIDAVNIDTINCLTLGREYPDQNNNPIRYCLYR
jgi:hypothetical protein